jgi:hypothetical protein
LKRLDEWLKFDNVELSVMIVALEDFLEKSPEFADECERLLMAYRKLLRERGKPSDH